MAPTQTAGRRRCACCAVSAAWRRSGCRCLSIPRSGPGRTPNRIAGSPALLTSLLEKAEFQDVEIIGPVSHNVHVASAEAYYDRFALTSPKIKSTLEGLDKLERAKVKAKVMELAKEQGGQEDGSISIPSMAYLAYGTKR